MGDLAFQTAVRFAGLVAFPRIAYWLRWPTRVGLRGFAVYVALNGAFVFAMRQFVLPRVRHLEAEMDRAPE